MDKKMMDKIKKEQEIPTEVMEKLLQGREDILKQKIEQETVISKTNMKKKVIFAVLLAAVLTLIVINKTTIGAAIEKAFGISEDAGVASVENNEIPVDLAITSFSNGREIKLTKFVATQKKFAFDYQFTIDDEKLRTLLEKMEAADTNFQDIRLGLFVEGSTEDIFGDVEYFSTFRVEGDTFYGSVLSTFNENKIPENAKLTLHIYGLLWEDREEYEKALAEASKTGSPFSTEIALQYEGDWQFEVEYKPLTQKSKPQITEVSNVQNVQAESDALQTTIKFQVNIEDVPKENQMPSITIYKNGVQTKSPSLKYSSVTKEFEFSMDLSTLDKTSVYEVQVNETKDETGEVTKKVGSFKLQNKN